MLTPRSVGFQRLLARLDELYAIGGGPGANRVAGSPDEDEAHRVAAGWMEEAGLETEVDPAGNLVGRVRGERPELPEVWTGSHLDSVPQGGRFDGPLGVACGLEAVARLGRRARTLGVVVFRGEEVGCIGSRAFCAAGVGLPGAFVEVHIEQGARLDRAGAPLAAVTAIAGQARRSFVFEGAPGHAGTTPMTERDDALVKAAEWILRVREAAEGIEGAVATVGEIEVEPGAVNVIPGRATLSLDARAPDTDSLERLASALGVDLAPHNYPVLLSDRIRLVLREELEQNGLPVVELVSWAGHDAAVLAAASVEAGMLFVRSLNEGVSHSPEELTAPDDIQLALGVLEATLARLAAA